MAKKISGHRQFKNRNPNWRGFFSKSERSALSIMEIKTEFEVGSTEASHSANQL